MYGIIKRLHTFACARAALTSRLSGSPRDASVSFLYFLVNLYRFWMHTWNVTAIIRKNILLKVCFATTIQSIQNLNAISSSVIKL